MPGLKPRTVHELGMEQVPVVQALIKVLDEMCDSAVRQQQAIEILTVCHSARMGNIHDALTVADGIHKHVVQLLTRDPALFMRNES